MRKVAQEIIDKSKIASVHLPININKNKNRVTK